MDHCVIIVPKVVLTDVPKVVPTDEPDVQPDVAERRCGVFLLAMPPPYIYLARKVVRKVRPPPEPTPKPVKTYTGYEKKFIVLIWESTSGVITTPFASSIR